MTIKLTPPTIFLENLPPKPNFMSLAPVVHHMFRIPHATGINSFIPKEVRTIAISMKAAVLNNIASIVIDFPLRSIKYGQTGSKVTEKIQQT
jgi:hypothetical protein